MANSVFEEAWGKEVNKTETANGMCCYKSTDSALLELFSNLSSMRNDKNIEHEFEKAYAEDKKLAVRLMFYARNVRPNKGNNTAGLGERSVAKSMYKWMAVNHPKEMIPLVGEGYIEYFGRWDDFYVFEGTPVEDDAFAYMKEAFIKDYEAVSKYNENKDMHKPEITMVGKWLKSCNSKNVETKRLGQLTAKKFGLSEKKYRAMTKALREYLDVVEKKMSSKRFEDIKFSAVPSRAHYVYRDAFIRNAGSRYAEYISNVNAGKEKINTKCITPGDIVKKYYTGDKCSDTLDIMWENLEDFVDSDKNVLVMADTSGSMYGEPLYNSIGLAMYFAGRNKGVMRGKFMTFSERPQFVQLNVDDSIRNQISSFRCINENTNIARAFEELLSMGVRNNIPAEEMPVSIVIISDGQFDSVTHSCDCVNRGATWNKDFFETISEMYEKAGYEVPNIVFWNMSEVDYENTHVSSKNMPNVQAFCGRSTSTFMSVLRNIGVTPYEAMLNVLNAGDYAQIYV